MSEPTGASIAMPCAKGCGKPVAVSEAQVALLRGLPAAARWQHEHCEGENDTLDVPLRTYDVEIVVRESDAAVEGAEGQVVARMSASTQAGSFADACDVLGAKLSTTWLRIAEAAAIADAAP